MKVDKEQQKWQAEKKSCHSINPKYQTKTMLLQLHNSSKLWINYLNKLTSNKYSFIYCTLGRSTTNTEIVSRNWPALYPPQVPIFVWLQYAWTFLLNSSPIDIEYLPIHYHCVERSLAVFIGASTVADGTVALVPLTDRATTLHCI